MKKIRRSQYITPFGVGSMFDIGNESLIAYDISHWQQYQGERISLKRLARKLNVREFRMPEIQKNFWEKPKLGVPFARFPRWLFCSSCRSLKYYKEKIDDVPKCNNPKCHDKVLTPMRFVAACKDGHLSDIDWHYWAHSRSQTKNQHVNCQVRDKLQFRNIPNRGGGLASLEIYCQACNSRRDLSDLFSPSSLKSIGVKCPGKQPWQSTDQAVDCEEELRVSQRGASNIYFPKVISALDIPIENTDDSNIDDEILKHPDFIRWANKKEASNNLSSDLEDHFFEQIEAEIPDVTRERIDELLVNSNIDNPEPNEDLKIDESEVLEEEWPMLLNPPEIQINQNFSAKEEDISNLENSFGLEQLFEKVVLISKLREVRALRGFQRLMPNNEKFIPVDLTGKKNWLPATEVFGEGIFIAFSSKAIKLWEEKNSDALMQRLSSMQSTYEKDNLSFLPKPTAKFVLLHTFSHLLIRQLSFECGYSSSALRERIYSNDSEMSGVLIYTADSDSEGALGGLVRQGESDRLIPTVLTALERGSWCSSDPVCRELDGQGMRGLNKAACHACTLLSETSCIAHNALLDRMLLIGRDETSNYGFFNSAMDKYWRSLKK